MSEAVVSKKQPKNLLYYINSILVFALMFGIGQLPPFGQITPLGMQILGIFVGVLYGWCTVSLIWPSLIGIIAIGLTDFCTVTESFSMGFGDDIPILVVVVYVLAAYLEESGLSAYMANWFISRKAGEGHPWIFTGLLFAATYMLSALVSLYATIIIIWAIFYKICEQIGEPRRSKYTAIVIAGVVIISAITGSLFPFKPFAVIQIGLTEKALGTPLNISFVTWFIFHFVMSVAIIVGYVLLAKLVLRPDVTRVKEAGAKYAYLRDEKMNKEQKVAAIVLFLFILGNILPSILPATVPGIAVLKNMGVVGLGTISVVALAIVKTKEGKEYVHIPKLISKGVNWELIILLAATMPLCDALEAEEVGILATVIAWMTETFSGLSATMFMIAFTALFLITTQVTHNLVLMIVFTPVLTKMGLTFGIHPFIIMGLIFYTAMTAYCTPAASSQAALIFGNREWVTTKDAYLLGFIVLIVAFVVLIGLGIPLGQILV